MISAKYFSGYWPRSHRGTSALADKSAVLAAKLRRHDGCPEDGKDALAAADLKYLSGAAEVGTPPKVSAIEDSSPFNFIADDPMLTEPPAWELLCPV